jgi:hypothetical protein
VKQVVLHGEAGDANEEGVALALNAVHKVVAKYSDEDIYNQDGTGGFCRQLPFRTLATGKRAGRKKDKQRVTVSLNCDAAGTDKRHLFIIGRSKRPRSFPKHFLPERDWRVRYRNNSSAWMMSADYQAWLKDWNSKLRGYAYISDVS